MYAELLIKGVNENPFSIARRAAWIDWLKTYQGSEADIPNVDEYYIIFFNGRADDGGWEAFVGGPFSNVTWLIKYSENRVLQVRRLEAKRDTILAVRNETESLNILERENNTGYNDHPNDKEKSNVQEQPYD